MSREILFRAKREATNEWVYGYFVNEYDDFQIYIQSQIITRNGREYVNENTLGQFTGLTDKNGTKIFEKDIIKTNQYQRSVSTDTFTIEFVEGNYYLCHDGCTSWTLRSFIDEVEVIGNVYDNPELIEK